MPEPRDKNELVKQIAEEEAELRRLEAREAELLSHIPKQGFKAAQDRLALEDKITAIWHSLRIKKLRLRLIPCR